MILRSLVVIVGCVNIMSDITVIIVLNECYMFFLSFGELLQILFLHCPQCDGCISLSLSCQKIKITDIWQEYYIVFSLMTHAGNHEYPWHLPQTINDYSYVKGRVLLLHTCLLAPNALSIIHFFPFCCLESVTLGLQL